MNLTLEGIAAIVKPHNDLLIAQGRIENLLAVLGPLAMAARTVAAEHFAIAARITTDANTANTHTAAGVRWQKLHDDAAAAIAKATAP